MEFSFNVNNILTDEITILDFNDVNKIIAKRKNNDMGKELCEIINGLGFASGRAQGLQLPITSSEKFINSENRIYIKKDVSDSQKRKVIGFIKVGFKKLYIFDRHGNQHHIEPLCVLDFYVHESVQRFGHGKLIFECMIENENVKPGQLAIDRPSPKFISFLAKHYNLKNGIHQANKFLVFDEIFTSWKSLIKHSNSRSIEIIKNGFSQNQADQPLNPYTPCLNQNLRSFNQNINSSHYKRPPSGHKKINCSRNTPSPTSIKSQNVHISPSYTTSIALQLNKNKNNSSQDNESKGGHSNSEAVDEFAEENSLKFKEKTSTFPDRQVNGLRNIVQDNNYKNINNKAISNFNLPNMEDSQFSGNLNLTLNRNSSWDIFGLQSPSHNSKISKIQGNQISSSNHLNSSSDKRKSGVDTTLNYLKLASGEEHKKSIQNIHGSPSKGGRYQKTSLW